MNFTHSGCFFFQNYSLVRAYSMRSTTFDTPHIIPKDTHMWRAIQIIVYILMLLLLYAFVRQSMLTMLVEFVSKREGLNLWQRAFS